MWVARQLLSQLAKVTSRVSLKETYSFILELFKGDVKNPALILAEKRISV
jgi:hypothetical protein